MLKIKSKETLAHMKEINNKIDCMAQGTLFSNLMEKNLQKAKHTHTHTRTHVCVTKSFAVNLKRAQGCKSTTLQF